jgi:hypothetical protein
VSHRKRYVVECVWSGYVSSQSRPCHRTVERNFIERFKALHTIAFTDGTTMSVTVRECKPREKVTEIRGYSSLLRDAVMDGHKGYVSVTDIHPPVRIAPKQADA